MNPINKGSNSWIAYAALAVVCIVWGTTFLAMRIGVADMPPFLFTVLRQVFAGAILLSFLIFVMKMPLPTKKNVLLQAFGGFFVISIGNGLVCYAEVNVSSSIAAIICSMMPIWMIVFNLILNKDEKPTFPIIMGMIIGLAGIIMIFGENLSDFSSSGFTWGIIMTFVANMGWAFGSIRMKKQNQTSNAFMNAGLQMLFGGIYLIPVSLVLEDYSTITWSASALYSLTYLILFGSVAAFACYSYAVKKLPMTIVSLYAYVNPIVAVVLGSIMLGEKFNLRMAFAMLVTIGGIYIVNKGHQLREQWRAQFTR